MNLTYYLTSDYDNNSDIPTLEKQTQTNPNLPAVAPAKAGKAKAKLKRQVLKCTIAIYGKILDR